MSLQCFGITNPAQPDPPVFLSLLPGERARYSTGAQENITEQSTNSKVTEIFPSQQLGCVSTEAQMETDLQSLAEAYTGISFVADIFN